MSPIIKTYLLMSQCDSAIYVLISRGESSLLHQKLAASRNSPLPYCAYRLRGLVTSLHPALPICLGVVLLKF